MLHSRLNKGITLFVLSIALIGCSSQSVKQEPIINGKEYTIYNDQGETLTQVITGEPKRIVVLGQGYAELLIHFGLEERIVGVAYLDNSYSKYENEILNLPIITKDWPSKEAILALNPDLIVGMSSAFSDERVGSISFWNQREIPVLTGINYTRGRTIDSYYEDIALLGKVFEIETETNEYIVKQKEMLTAIQEQTKKTDNNPTVLLFAGGQNDIYYYYGPSLCLVDEMVEENGGTYLRVSKDAYLEISLETILALNPDKIILTEFQKSDKNAAEGMLLNNPSLQTVTAIKNKDILTVDYTNAVRGSLELAELYQTIASFIHPEVFDEAIHE